MDPVPLIIVSLILSAFFSGTEIAFVSANKFRIELANNKQGSFISSIISGFIKAPSQFIGTMLVGNIIALVIFGISMAEALQPYILQALPFNQRSEAMLIILQTIISAFIIIITGEFLPKVLFRINPNKMLQVFALPILFFYYLFYPLVYLIRLFSGQVLRRIFKIDSFEANTIFGSMNLDHHIQEIKTESEGEFGNSSEIEMFQNAIAFNEIRVRESMIPRTEIIALGIDADIEELRTLFAETGLSRILIYRDNIDNIIGFVHSYEMFKQPKTIQSVILPITIVPESMLARELLTLFTQQHKSIALVVDEFGGTAGIVTMEDVIEEIFGDIDDEHDVEELIEKQIKENEFIFSGRLEIDYLNREYDLKLPEDESYETLAGLIIHHHESIPDINDEIIIAPYQFTILQVSDTKIEQVKLTNADYSE
ncbi:MAG: hemolysin family protein [Bacteroidia bacterium]